jgi:hypothetical protein
MRTLLVALLALALTPAIADARSSKGSTLIRVANDGDDVLAVIVDNAAVLDNASSSTLSASSFFRAGGRLIGPGGITVFSVRTGTHTVTGAYILDFGSRFTIGADSSTTATTTRNGQTVTVTATEAADGDASLTSSSP